MAQVSSEPSILLIFPLFIIVFASFWCFVCWILSHIGGWHDLSQQYRRQQKPTGQSHCMASAKVGLINYNSCLTFHSSADGLYMSVWPMFRIGHPPLLLPWAKLNNPELKSFLWVKYVVLEIGSPKITTIAISHNDFTAFQQQAEASGNNIGRKL